MKIPSTHQTVMPYLILKNASKFIDFAENVFNAKVIFKSFREDGGNRLAIVNFRLMKAQLCFSDANDNFQPQTGNLFVYVDDADKRFKIALDNGATILMDLSDQAYGRTCGVTDHFGNVWWITSLTD